MLQQHVLTTCPKFLNAATGNVAAVEVSATFDDKVSSTVQVHSGRSVGKRELQIKRCVNAIPRVKLPERPAKLLLKLGPVRRRSELLRHLNFQTGNEHAGF